MINSMNVDVEKKVVNPLHLLRHPSVNNEMITKVKLNDNNEQIKPFVAFKSFILIICTLISTITLILGKIGCPLVRKCYIVDSNVDDIVKIIFSAIIISLNVINHFFCLNLLNIEIDDKHKLENNYGIKFAFTICFPIVLVLYKLLYCAKPFYSLFYSYSVVISTMISISQMTQTNEAILTIKDALDRKDVLKIEKIVLPEEFNDTGSNGLDRKTTVQRVVRDSIIIEKDGLLLKDNFLIEQFILDNYVSMKKISKYISIRFQITIVLLLIIYILSFAYLTSIKVNHVVVSSTMICNIVLAIIITTVSLKQISSYNEAINEIEDALNLKVDLKLTLLVQWDYDLNIALLIPLYLVILELILYSLTIIYETCN